MVVLNLDRSAWTLHAGNDASPIPDFLRARLNAGIPANVPGCVHTDLLAEKLIPDPYIADGELYQFWVGHTDWVYSTKFELSPVLLQAEHLELVCDGLDTIAELTLNGQSIGTAANMHASYRFDLRHAARSGENTLRIAFTSPRKYAESQDDVYPGLPRQGGAQGKVNPHNLIRKMACNMGWDWGPDVATSGIWRSIRIAGWNTARIESVRPLIRRADAGAASVEVHVDSAGTGAVTQIETTLRDPAGEVVYQRIQPQPSSFIEVSQPQLWWPAGHGEQPLYTLNVRILNDSGDELDQWQRRIGLRTSRLEILSDPHPVGEPIPNASGESMTLKVNGKAIYCKGANWIPDDCFPHRVTPKRYRQRIEQARWANMNMLRVWGGGLYESDAFYEICDELGMMVWQDFLFACACYPEEQPYRGLVELEVRQNVARLSSHPSLVIWNGCNENVWGTFDWGPAWRAIREEGKRTWGLGYYLEILPSILKELDPVKPYWPASPYSGSMDRWPNQNEYGNVHIWDVWHGAGQYHNYLAYFPRMATEFGYHGPASYATIARSIPCDQREWNSPLMQLHNKNGRPGQEQTNVRMADDFVPPTDNYDDWHYLAQVMQARALSMGIEWFRSLYPWNAGTLYWQLNDCYPVSSWSAIDGDGRPKPLLYASRRFFAPRLCTVKPRVATSNAESEGLAVYLHNDHDETWNTACSIKQMSLDGQTLREMSHELVVGPRQLVKVAVPSTMAPDDDTFIVATTNEGRGFWWFAPDSKMNYPEPKFESRLAVEKNAYQLTISAQSLLRDLCIFPDRLDEVASVSDNFVTLLPGEERCFTIMSSKKLDVELLTAFPVLNCVNRFGRSHSSALKTMSSFIATK